MPHVRSYMQPSTFVLDILNKAAAIPGTGNEPMTFIYTFDLAKYLVRFLALPEWAETTYCFGDNITWNEFLKLAEEARGKLPSALSRLAQAYICSRGCVTD